MNVSTHPENLDAVPASRHPWSRYVALGDSFTEGIGDPEPSSPGGYRGWADRLAEELSRGHEDFRYANLAIRGRLLAQILDGQLEPALELKPDLISISAGGNDLIRPGSDPDALAERLDVAVGRMSAAGATVLLFNGPDIRDTPVLGMVRGRVAIYNENLRTIAARHDAVVADMWSLRELTGSQMWADDRLHFAPLGHHTIAIMALNALNVPHSLVPALPKPLPAQKWQAARSEDLVWAREFLMPWVLRRLRHQSSGDGILAKRPTPGPVFGAAFTSGLEQEADGGTAG
ncbi:SGNH/GDSL hydrolase family protein [Arthrobacter cryoconiti]|uniref:SGNH/GDSL hydrolase family protein n=1 Tax=Arthrobacter cryoconiti TaxID=748907 RepID=A0ABV8R5S5_9MICC|nr:SGNH/GDSL hydrolase family protein [Arthrobacter cryoconiti]MCC9067136.1 SGNH/GDSL hydrolase family protein [Arthrobacter cryoconiti]